MNVATLCAAVFGLVVVGCGGPQFDGRVYDDGDISFRLSSVPRAWRRIDADGALLAFRDDDTPASIVVNGRCGKDGDDVPLRSLTHHLFIHFTDRNVLSQERVELDGRAALETELVARLDGVQKHYTVVVLKKDGCVYDFVHISPPSRGDSSRERFRTLVRGFSTREP